MRTRRGGELRLTSGDAESLLAFAYRPFDIRTLTRSIPGPASDAVAGVGHILRAYVDPMAWVRDVSLEIAVREITVRGGPDELAEAELRMPAHTDADDRGLFCWSVNIASDEAAEPVVGWMDHMGAADVAELLDRDAGPDGLGLLARHKAAVETSMAEIVAASLPEGVEVSAVADLTVFGLSYDRGLAGQEHSRSPIEAPAEASFFERLRARHADPEAR